MSLGVITYLTLMTLLRDLISIFTGHLYPVYWVVLPTALVMFLGFLHAYFGPHVKHIELLIDGLHPDLAGLKIVQLSDLHVGPTIRKKYVSRVTRKVMELNPDIITMTGDIGDGPVKTYADDIHPFINLKAKLGSYYVTGNHEYYWNGNDWVNLITGLGHVPLINHAETLCVGNAKVSVAGIPDPVSRIEPQLEKLSQIVKESDFKILLSHRPGVARQAEKNGFNLQLSGHTHGGQFFPWTLVVRFVHEFDRGLARIGKMWVYVNVGTGSWGPFLRVGSTTEITLIELKAS